MHAQLPGCDHAWDQCLLRHAEREAYLTAETWLEGAIPAWLEPGAELVLVPSPEVAVTELLRQLSSDADRDVKKRSVFSLKLKLQNAVFSDEFVMQARPLI